MNTKTLTTAVTAVLLLLLSCVARAQPQNISELIKEIQMNMDRNLDPCHDFYEFACGGFTKTHPVPANTTGEYLNWPVFEAVVNDTVKTIRRVVEQPWPIVNDFYRSCDRSQSEINRSAEESLRVYADWLNKTSLSTDTEIWNALATLSTFEPFFSVEASLQTDNNIVTFRGPAIVPEHSYLTLGEYANAKKVAEFLEFASQAFLNETKSVATQKAETVLDVDRYLANFNNAPWDEYILTISNASRLTNTDWEAYFAKSGVHLNSDDKIYFPTLNLFQNLTKFLSSLSEQSLKNYLQFKVYENIWEINETLTCYTGEGDCDGQLMLPGYPSFTHEDRCALLTWAYLFDLVSFIITEEIDAQTSTAAQKVASSLKEATNSSLTSLKWISSSTDLKAATGKIQDVVTTIGRQTTERFSGVETQPDNFFDNALSIATYVKTKYVRDSYRVLNRTDYTVDPSFDVNNVLEANLIFVPPALVNSEVFSTNWPKLFQFAKLGGLIGRQFVHAIDSEGQFFPVYKDGSASQLFSDDTENAYMRALLCVVSAYENFLLPNTTFDTGYNIVEDIADIGGLRNSYQAYQAYIARYGKEFPDGGVIPGFSTNQVFFLISAQMSCSAENAEYLKSTKLAPIQVRTNGALSQSPEFAKAYNCPVDSPMNPARKCNIF